MLNRLDAVRATAHAVIESKLRTDDMRLQNLPQQQDVVGEIGHSRHQLRACNLKVVMGRTPTLPEGSRIDGEVGAVVLKLNIDESGAVTDSVVAGSMGGGALVRSVSGVVPTWRFEKEGANEANCRLAQEFFYTYSYYYY